MQLLMYLVTGTSLTVTAKLSLMLILLSMFRFQAGLKTIRLQERSTFDGCAPLGGSLKQQYIFPRPRKVSPRDGTEVKTCFICRGKVSFSAVVEKKDSCLTERSSCLTDRSSCLPERSEGRQRREVRQRSEVRQSFWAETKVKETFSRQRKWSDRTVSIPGILTFIAGGYIFFR